jgi:hypothetical protein
LAKHKLEGGSHCVALLDPEGLRKNQDSSFYGITTAGKGVSKGVSVTSKFPCQEENSTQNLHNSAQIHAEYIGECKDLRKGKLNRKK